MTETPLTARRAQTRDRLMDAAITAFAEKGVLGSPVEEICERAGFTRGAFYSNFNSKDELCVAVLRRKGEEVLRAATQATDVVPRVHIEPASAEAVIRAAVDVFQAGHPADPEWLMARMELRLYALRNPSVREALQSAERQLGELLTQAIVATATRVGARFAIPVDRIFTLLDAQYEALFRQATMADRDLAGWTDQMATLLRAIVILPDGDGPASAS